MRTRTVQEKNYTILSLMDNLRGSGYFLLVFSVEACGKGILKKIGFLWRQHIVIANPLFLTEFGFLLWYHKVIVNPLFFISKNFLHSLLWI